MNERQQLQAAFGITPRAGSHDGGIIFIFAGDASARVQTRDTPPETTRAMTLALSTSSGFTRSFATTSRQPSHV